MVIVMVPRSAGQLFQPAFIEGIEIFSTIIYGHFSSPPMDRLTPTVCSDSTLSANMQQDLTIEFMCIFIERLRSENGFDRQLLQLLLSETFPSFAVKDVFPRANAALGFRETPPHKF